MSVLKTYDLFISHAWAYNDEYYKLIDLLNEANYFKYRNYSVPQHDPLIDPNQEIGRSILVKELDQQIRPVNCVLVISGMYVAYKYWIQKEIELAQKYNKPIIGVKPWGNERVPNDIQVAASELINWSSNSIISAIRNWSI